MIVLVTAGIDGGRPSPPHRDNQGCHQYNTHNVKSLDEATATVRREMKPDLDEIHHSTVRSPRQRDIRLLKRRRTGPQDTAVMAVHGPLAQPEGSTITEPAHPLGLSR
jgi:hypothetical protein